MWFIFKLLGIFFFNFPIESNINDYKQFEKWRKVQRRKPEDMMQPPKTITVNTIFLASFYLFNTFSYIILFAYITDL